MWLMSKLLQWVELHPEKDIVVAGVGIALAVALGLFAALKSYPVDYDADGKLLVDGAKMANDTFKGVGWAIAFCVGWVLERRFVRFSTEVPVATRLTRLAVGVLSYYAVALILVPLLKNMIPGAPGTTISCFLQMFFITFISRGAWCILRDGRPRTAHQNRYRGRAPALVPALFAKRGLVLLSKPKGPLGLSGPFG